MGSEQDKKKAAEICAANGFPVSYVERWVSERNQKLANSIATALTDNGNQVDVLHIAICQAVALMNGEIQIGGNAQAHHILRSALVEYADAIAAKAKDGGE